MVNDGTLGFLKASNCQCPIESNPIISTTIKMCQLRADVVKKIITWVRSLNVRGLMEKIDKTRLTDDTLSYKIQILEIQETHMKDTELLRNSYK